MTNRTQLTESRAVDYLINEDTGLLTYEELQDIARHGCAACAPDKLAYYKDTWEFFFKFEEDVDDYFYNKYGISWVERFAKNTTSVGGMINKIVWTYVNQIAKEVTQTP